MQHVDVSPYTGLTFKLENEEAAYRSTSQPPAGTHIRNQSSNGSNLFLPPDAPARQSLANSYTSGQHSLPQRPLSAHEAATNWRRAPTSNPGDKTQSVIDAIVGTEVGAETAVRIGYFPKSTTAQPPSGNIPDENKKEYCTYWIRTGECDYAQQGCSYKHDMPDKATLEKIGFRTVPRWWLEKTQAIKIGGERASVGPLVKPSVWLKSKESNHSDADDDETESSDFEKGSLKAGSRQTSAGKLGGNAVVTKHPTQASAEKIGGEAVATKHPTQPSARTPILSPNEARKDSTTSDLVDFATLVPTPPSSPSTSMSKPPSPTRSDSSEPLKPPHSELKQEHSSKSSTQRTIFVPAGESPDNHIIEARKRAARNHSGRARASIGNPEATPLDKQIQNLQKKKVNSGLMASKHAPPGDGIFAKIGQAATAHKRDTKSGCRTRRPAPSTAASA